MTTEPDPPTTEIFIVTGRRRGPAARLQLGHIARQLIADQHAVRLELDTILIDRFRLGKATAALDYAFIVEAHRRARFIGDQRDRLATTAPAETPRAAGYRSVLADIRRGAL